MCEGKEAMRNKEGAKDLGVSAACTLRLMKEGKYHAGSESKSLFLVLSWFGSVKLAAEIAKN